MTLAPKNLQNNRQGFTLLELVMVMVVITIILASAVILLTSSKSPLSDISREVAKTVSEAHRSALVENTATFLIARSDRLWVTNQIVDEDLQAADPSEGIEKYLLPEGIQLAYRGAENAEWKTLERGDSPIIWCFSSSGLSEAIFLRITREEGYAEMEFDPLTGGVVR